MHAHERAFSYTAYTLHDRAGTHASIYIYTYAYTHTYTHTEITKLLLPCCNLATALIKYTLQQGSVNLLWSTFTLACKWALNTLLQP